MPYFEVVSVGPRAPSRTQARGYWYKWKLKNDNGVTIAKSSKTFQSTLVAGQAYRTFAHSVVNAPVIDITGVSSEGGIELVPSIRGVVDEWFGDLVSGIVSEAFVRELVRVVGRPMPCSAYADGLHRCKECGALRP